MFWQPHFWQVFWNDPFHCAHETFPLNFKTNGMQIMCCSHNGIDWIKKSRKTMRFSWCLVNISLTLDRNWAIFNLSHISWAELHFINHNCVCYYLKLQRAAKPLKLIETTCGYTTFGTFWSKIDTLFIILHILRIECN